MLCLTEEEATLIYYYRSFGEAGRKMLMDRAKKLALTVRKQPQKKQGGDTPCQMHSQPHQI